MSVRKTDSNLSWKSAAFAALFSVIAGAQFALAQSAGFQGIPLVKFSISGFEVDGDNPLSAQETEKILAEFLGEHEGVDGLQAAADELEAAIVRAGHEFHRVTLPPQRALGGVVRLQVLTFSLGEIKVSGNKFFDVENVRASVPALVEGAAPNTDLVGEQIEFANLHPSKQIRLVMKDSETEDAINAELQVEDIDPEQLFLTFNNTGSDATGVYRLGLGYTNSNLTGADDALTFTYTTSPEKIDKVTQLGAVYRLPIYGTQTALTLNAVYSDVDSGEVANSLTVSGAGQFVGAKIEHSLPKMGNYRQTLKLSLDDKLFLNDVNLVGVPIGVDVASRPLAMGYASSYQLPEVSAALGIDYVRNVTSGRNNNATAYNATRAGATPDWEAYRLTANVDLQLADGWSLKSRLNSQYSMDMLIPGEQFGFGGSTGLRGFTEREVTGDRGYAVMTEVWTPILAEQFQLLGFVDYGEIWVNNPAVGQQRSDTATTTGLGVRATFSEQLSVSVDYGYVLNGAATTQQDKQAFHGSVLYRF